MNRENNGVLGLLGEVPQEGYAHNYLSPVGYVMLFLHQSQYSKIVLHDLRDHITFCLTTNEVDYVILSIKS